jgi:hypothetical protein
MDRRIWIVLALAGAVLVAWRLWPGGGSSSAPAAGTRSDSAQEDAPSPTSTAQKTRLAPPAPVRMQARSGSPSGPRAGVSIMFEAEDRDEEWAAAREAEVRVRAGRALGDGVTLGDVECRSRSCRLAIGSEDPVAVARAIERLGEDGGFHGYADQMTVETAEAGEGGPRRMNVYLRFSR